MKTKIIAVILIMAMLFGFSSCKKKNDNSTPKDEDLTVEIEELEYTESDITDASSEITALATELFRVLGYSNQVEDEDLKQIDTVFRSDILPIMIDVKIYPSELMSLLACAKECIALADNDAYKEATPKILSDMYTKCVSVIDADRFGALVYELQIFAINRKAMSVQEKYDKYGYIFYLEEVKYYESVVEKAKSLGRADFSSAVSALIFTASAFNGSANFEGDGVSISVSDSIAVMERQAKKFAELGLDGNDWQIVAEMFEVFIPNDVSDDLKGRVMLALDDSDFFIKAMAVMPDLIEFYAEITKEVSKENIALIENKAECAYVRAVCAEIVKKEGAFRKLLSALEEKIPEASEKCLDLVNTYEKPGYSAFLTNYNCSASELINSIKAFSSDPTAYNYDTLLKNCIGYAAGINSVVTYVYLYK